MLASVNNNFLASDWSISDLVRQIIISWLLIGRYSAPLRFSTNQKPGFVKSTYYYLPTPTFLYIYEISSNQSVQFETPKMQVVNPPKILNFNLIDNFKIVYEDKNLTSNPKQTKKRNFKQFCKKFLRFFCFDAGDEDDYIITNSFSPPGANSEYEEDKSKITFRPYTVIIEYDPREPPLETFQTKQSRIASLKEYKANSPKYKPKRLKYK